MDDVRLVRVDFNREKQIIINLILNDKFCSTILPIIDHKYFRSSYAKTIIKWVQDYYSSYKKAPAAHIRHIYEQHRKQLDQDEFEQIGTILGYLSDVSDTKVHNVDFLIDSADRFFKERHLELQNTALEAALAKGDTLSAERIVQNVYKGIQNTSHTFKKLDDITFVRDCVRTMVRKLDDSEVFFKFPGRLGDFLGPFSRKWFVAFLAPAKRGKTTYMIDSAIASITRRLHTVIISLEMPSEQLMARYMLAITGAYPEISTHTHMVPLMDCEANQDGTCTLDCREGAGSILGEVKLTYDDNPDWIRCEVCRAQKAFRPASWKEPVEKKYISEGDYIKKVTSFNRLFGKYGRIIHLPSKSVTVQDIKERIEELRNNENFIPDVVVLDYADLIKPEINSGHKRHDLDDIWEHLRGWAQEDNFLLISASQTNRISADVAYIKDIHVAEDYSKIAKLDVGIGLCQTDQMKLDGIMNINKVVHRHEEYIQSHVCTVLQDMKFQQSSLDSEFVYYS